MTDEPLASGFIEVAETHPHMLRWPYPLSALGEVSHLWGVGIFVGAMLTGVAVSIWYVPPWFAVWWSVSKLTAHDYHMPETLILWTRTAALDTRKGELGGTSVSDNPRAWNVPLGMYDDAA